MLACRSEARWQSVGVAAFKGVSMAMVVPNEFHEYAQKWMRAAGDMTWRLVFPGRADQVVHGRRLAGYLLMDTGHADDAAWIATELISNALLHSRSGEPGGWFGVEVTRRRVARVAVQDLGGKGVPRLPVTSDEVLAEHGRGLRGILELAVSAGVCGNPQEGHLVWAQLPLRPRAARCAS